ncbi:ParA family protein [Chitinimonas sp.]|uniref:ParA family protein n=1 Tax=Chitinimonas sp. TaxID=1934313 RepID=UPI0035ADEC1A
MRRILVANPKGGSGKSTLATHLASWFAHKDELVYLGDVDRQRSSQSWIQLRPERLPRVRYWEVGDDEPAAPPSDADVAIIDSPAGLYGKRLKQLLAESEHVLVPVPPSTFDLLASRDFFEELAETKAMRKERVTVAVVGMRVDFRTRAAQQLAEFVGQFDLPLLGCIRDTQRYVRCIQEGRSLFDLPQSQTEQDRAQWQPVLRWLYQPR